MKDKTEIAYMTFLRDSGFSVSEIARRLGCSRPTVRKYLKVNDENQKILTESSDEEAKRKVTEFLNNGPVYNSKSRRPRKVNEELVAIISGLMHEEEVKKDALGHIKAKQMKTAKTIHSDVVSYGFDVSYSTVSRIIKELKEDKHRETFIKQRYDYGERIEFDFGEAKILLGGRKTKVFLAIMSAPASGYRFIKAYTNQRQPVVKDAVVSCFEELHGSYRTVVFDNMKPIVRRFIENRDRVLQPEIVSLLSYYGSKPVLTNPYRGNEKGTVESGVHWGTNDLFSEVYSFASKEELDEHISKKNSEYNAKTDIEEEKKHLLPYRSPYETAQITIQKVDKYSFIHLDSNIYSVPEELTLKEVTVKKYSDEIVVYYKNMEVMRSKRLAGKNKECVELKHYLNTLLKKPGALENSVALRNLPELRKTFQNHYSQNPKEFIQLLIKNKDVLDSEELADLLDPEKSESKINEKMLEYGQQQMIDIASQFLKGKETNETVYRRNGEIIKTPVHSSKLPE